MMLRPEPVEDLVARFADEAAAIRDAGFRGHQDESRAWARKDDIKLAEAVRARRRRRLPLHGGCQPLLYDGGRVHGGPRAGRSGCLLVRRARRARGSLTVIARLRAGLRVNISGGEAEFNRWGWRAILENRGLDIAQPEVCALGGHHRIPTRPGPGPCAFHTRREPCLGQRDCGRHEPAPAGGDAAPARVVCIPWEPMLEFDTTDNAFRDELLTEPLNIQQHVRNNNGRVPVPTGPGLGVEPDRDVLARYTGWHNKRPRYWAA